MPPRCPPCSPALPRALAPARRRSTSSRTAGALPQLPIRGRIRRGRVPDGGDHRHVPVASPAGASGDLRSSISGAHRHDLAIVGGARPDRVDRRDLGVPPSSRGPGSIAPPVPRPVQRRRGDHNPRLRTGAINLCAVRIAPLTGIPLPFVSYGGSSLIVLLAAVGVLLNIAVNDRVVEARSRDSGRGNSRSHQARSRSRGGTARSRSDRDVRRQSRPRRVASGS